MARVKRRNTGQRSSIRRGWRDPGRGVRGAAALLFAIAYRLLGSASEAEDAVQEAWLRSQSSPTPPASAKAFLPAVVIRISIDVLRSARARREKYVGQWFPEPLLNDPYEDPARSAELADSAEQRMEPEALLPRRCSLLLVRMRDHNGRIQVQDQTRHRNTGRHDGRQPVASLDQLRQFLSGAGVLGSDRARVHEVRRLPAARTSRLRTPAT